MFLEWKQLEYITGFDFRPKCELDPEMLASLTIRPTLIERIGSSQRDDPNVLEIISKLEMDIDEEMNKYGLDRDGWLRKNGKLVVPNVNGLRDEVLSEFHHSKLTIHPGGNKMYRDMKHTY